MKTYKVVMPGAQVLKEDGKFARFNEAISLDDETGSRLALRGIVREAGKTETAELEELEKAAAASTTTNKPKSTKAES